ncbi:hypothetical protein GQ53DRAFT_745046 [Thozetella sp. PMI_491]|nr:hypothetical protein GQ53DRAFT_745046 [Thozetella sp. PMI_491]
MPTTEIFFPTFKSDAESLAGVRENQWRIPVLFQGVAGIETAYTGQVLEENGVSVDPETMRISLAIEWVEPSFFHAFFPNSEKFKSFVANMKPFMAVPASPELYEAAATSSPCLNSEVTQVLRVRSGSATEEAWKRLESRVEDLTGKKAVSYHAPGIEKDAEFFLGLFGWPSWEEYERVGKDAVVLQCIENLSDAGKPENIIVKNKPLALE